jgi:dihydrofolate synthase/folylpolyglutamate synthase
VDVHLSDYRAALDSLFARTTGGWKFGLDRTHALLAALGNPHERFRSFHVGGTNGKGSVVATLDTLLRAHGLRVGRYTSPHLVDFRERIVIDGAPVAGPDVTDWIDRWMPEVDRTGATFFEATTCMAFDLFARAGVDVAVVEVGLGGRLDTTNVVTPLAAGVTSIGLEHTEYLGESLEEIAREKAGIFKVGVPAVVGEQDEHIREVLGAAAREAHATPVVITAVDRRASNVRVAGDGTRFTLATPQGSRELHTPLVGDYQAANTAVALTMLETAGGEYAAAGAAADRTLSGVRIAGRFQRIGTLVFDVAHNPPAVDVLCRTLDAVHTPAPIVALLAVLKDKDWPRMMEQLAPHVARFVLAAPPSVPTSRAWRIEDAVAFARSRGWDAVGEPDLEQAVALARRDAATTLITGSFHTVGDVMALLQLSPLSG